jgi:hypothetical protein
MNQSVPVQIFQRRCQTHPNLQAFAEWQPRPPGQVAPQSPWFIGLRLNRLARDHIVSELHNAVKVPATFISADMKNADKAGMRARDRLEALEAGKFPLEWVPVRKRIAPDDLDRAISSYHAFGQPNRAVATLANAPNQLVIRDAWRRGRQKDCGRAEGRLLAVCARAA